MSGKDLLIDFATYVVGILLFAFVIFFIVLGDRFEPIMKFFINIAPMMIFALIGVVILHLRKREIKRKKEEEDRDEIILHLNYSDRLASDLVFTGLPVLIMLVAFFMKASVDADDIFQAGLVFVFLYLYFRSLYKKSE